ncbi:MAG: hypothetical protein R3281_03805 [Balneolaceae bacterium]|nr:hypothetical protein [Balneolaceae bacterium]
MNTVSYLRSSALSTALSVLCLITAEAQVVGTVPSPFESIEQNSVSNMAAIGDTLWIGPGLNRNIGNAEDWFLPQGADSIISGRGRVFSLALVPDTVFSGLGFNFVGPEGPVQTGIGYHLSTDGGESWSFLPLPLDSESDSTFIYGGESYRRLPITVPQQSPPFDIAFNNGTIFTANWASGILRSRNFGGHWESLVLPPAPADSLVPDSTYRFTSATGNENIYDPRGDQNLLGFSVHIDRRHRVWAGTAAGVNMSSDALTAPPDSIRWKHFRVDNSDLLGNWVIRITEQPATGDIWMTNWVSGLSSSEQFGVVRTGDGGRTFQQYLVGQQINDIGFKGTHIFAAGNEGLFISPDNGNSWQQVEQIRSANSFIKASARYFSVAVTSNRVWIGTSDGLASTGDLGKSWEITRVNFPLSGGNQYQSGAPDTKTFAYPNPFSPSRQALVRIKFEVREAGSVRIRLFDFGMNLVRQLENDTFPEGTYEAVWDGRSSNGNIVANGPVFYQVTTPGGVARGKILVID